jgi:hypothetical protein
MMRTKPSPDVERALAGRKQELADAENVTRNYVVFDDKLIDILRKYGWAGIAATLGYGSAEEAKAAAVWDNAKK